MMTTEKVLENIKGIGTVDSLKELNNEVICAFENFEFEGESSVIFEESNNSDYVAYIDQADAPEIKINVDVVKNEDGEIESVTILDAWIA